MSTTMAARRYPMGPRPGPWRDPGLRRLGPALSGRRLPMAAIFYSALISLDRDVVSAAEIDGANWWEILFLIKFPLIWATIAASVVLVVSGTLRGFDVSFVMTNGGPGTSSELVSTYMYKTLFNRSNFGFGSAIAVFLVVECLLVVAIIRKAFDSTERGVEA